MFGLKASRGVIVSGDILRLRRISAGKLRLADNLTFAFNDVLNNRQYRLRNPTSWPIEIIQTVIAAHPPIVIKREKVFHAIGNLRSVELAAYLRPETRVLVLEHAPLPENKILSQCAEFEFLTLAFGSLAPSFLDQSALSLWEHYKAHENFPPQIQTKLALADQLAVNRRRLSRKAPKEVKLTFN